MVEKHLNSEMHEIIEREITVIEETLIPKSLNFQEPSVNRQQDAMKKLCYDMNQRKPYHKSFEMSQRH